MKIILTVLACIIVAVVGAVAFIYSGIYNVSTLQPDNPVIAWALHTTSDHSVDARLGDIVAPDNLDQPAVIQSGAQFFGAHCVVCHGGPGLKPSPVAQGLNPSPPNLFRATRKPKTTEMFYFIKNGVKMTGMPGFGKSISDDQIWAVTAFLRKAPGMTPQDFAAQTGVSEAN